MAVNAIFEDTMLSRDMTCLNLDEDLIKRETFSRRDSCYRMRKLANIGLHKNCISCEILGLMLLCGL